MRLLSQFLLIYLGSSFTSLSLRLSTFHAHYRVLLATLCSIQNLSLGVCPSWSTFLDFVSRISLVPDLRKAIYHLLIERQCIDQLPLLFSQSSHRFIATLFKFFFQTSLQWYESSINNLII